MNWKCYMLAHVYGPEQEETRHRVLVREHLLTGGVREYTVWERPRFRICTRCDHRLDVGSRFTSYQKPLNREELSALRLLAVSSELSSDEAFAYFVARLVGGLGMHPGDLGNALSVSRATVTRWMDGKTAPHQAMREPVRTMALVMIDARLAKIDVDTQEKA